MGKWAVRVQPIQVKSLHIRVFFYFLVSQAYFTCNVNHHVGKQTNKVLTVNVAETSYMKTKA